jgi:hypothetical protein
VTLATGSRTEQPLGQRQPGRVRVADLPRIGRVDPADGSTADGRRQLPQLTTGPQVRAIKSCPGPPTLDRVLPDPDADVPPTWDTIDRLTSEVADPRVGWGRRVLQRFLGDSWPTTQWSVSRWLPSELIDAGVHISAGPRLLQLAANLISFAHSAGFEDAASRVRAGGITRSDWHHLVLQLEIARAGLTFDATVRFEPAIDGTARKADVELRGPDTTTLCVEAVALWPASASTANEAWDRDLRWRLDEIARVERVAMECEVSDHPGDDPRDEWLDKVRALAATVARSGITTVSEPGWCRLEVTAANDSGRDGVVAFSGMPNIRDGWARARKVLRDKARQTRGADNVWIRMDMLDGLFAFSGWAQESPQKRLSWMRQLLLDTLRIDAHVHGVILSSGASFTWATAGSAELGEDVSAEGAALIRREISPHLARETLIVPLNAHGNEVARLWASAYASEPTWLNHDLQDVTKPSGTETG